MTNLSTGAIQSIAEVATSDAPRYLQQLCKHFQHRLPVTFDERSGRIEFSIGECRLEADDGLLKLSLSTSGAGQMGELQDIVARHLLRFAFRDPPKIEWRAADIQGLMTHSR